MRKLSTALHAFWTILTNKKHVFHSESEESFYGTKSDKDNSVRILNDIWEDIEPETFSVRLWKTRKL